MMGSTHGLAGLATAGAIASAATAAGVHLDAAEAAAIVVAGALAAEAPDLDLRTSRISHGTSTLTGIRVLRPLALLITLPLVLAGAAVRALGADHRGPTHSPAAAVLSTPLILALYTGYLQLLDQGAHLADRRAPDGAPLHLHHLTGHLVDLWPHVLPWIATAWLAAYLTHLVLDELTTAPQALLWPLRTRKVRVLSRPSIPVGGIRELLLVAAPLAVITTAIALHATGGTTALRQHLNAATDLTQIQTTRSPR